MTILLKDAVADDLSSINNILRLSKAHWGYDSEYLDRFMKKLGITQAYLERHTIKLFYIDGALAGFFNFSVNDENLYELDNFFLHPSYIGKGMGRKLWDACCQAASEQEKDEFIIWSDPNAEQFYIKMGCEKIGVRQSPMIPNSFPPILKFKLSYR